MATEHCGTETKIKNVIFWGVYFIDSLLIKLLFGGVNNLRELQSLLAKITWPAESVLAEPG